MGNLSSALLSWKLWDFKLDRNTRFSNSISLTPIVFKCSPNFNFPEFIVQFSPEGLQLWGSPFYVSKHSHLSWEDLVFQIFNQFLNHIARYKPAAFNVPNNDYWLLVTLYSNCFSLQGIVLLGKIIRCSMFWDRKHLKMLENLNSELCGSQLALLLNSNRSFDVMNMTSFGVKSLFSQTGG